MGTSIAILVEYILSNNKIVMNENGKTARGFFLEKIALLDRFYLVVHTTQK